MSNWESLQPKKNEKKLGFDLGMQLGEVAICTTNVHTKNECLCHYKTVIRSTEPPISCRCCYGLVIVTVSLFSCFQWCFIANANR
jgi:hypothetical protein